MPLNYNSEHPIFNLANEGKLDQLKEMMSKKSARSFFRRSKKTSLNDKRTADHLTPLLVAAIAGHLPIVQWLLSPEGGSSKNECNENASSALLFAAYNGRLDVVEWLVDSGNCDINQANTVGATAITLAASNGHLDIVQWLINKDPESIKNVDNFGNTALILAAENDQLETVKWLVSNKKSKINETNSDGHTALGIAAWKGHLAIVTYLLEHPDITYKYLRTTFHLKEIPLNNNEVNTLIQNKMESYDELIEQSYEEALKTFKVTDTQIIVANKLFCPIKYELIVDPVTAKDGLLYEKRNITIWFTNKDTSPLTNAILDDKTLTPSEDIIKIIAQIDTAIETLYRKVTAAKTQQPIVKESKIPVLMKSKQYAGYKPLFVSTSVTTLTPDSIEDVINSSPNASSAA